VYAKEHIQYVYGRHAYIFVVSVVIAVVFEHSAFDNSAFDIQLAPFTFLLDCMIGSQQQGVKAIGFMLILVIEA